MDGANFRINGCKAFRINFCILIFVCSRARIILRLLASTRVNNVVFGGVNGEGVPRLQRSPMLLDGQGLDAEIARLTSFPLAADFSQIFPFPWLNRSRHHFDSQQLRIAAVQRGILADQCVLFWCELGVFPSKLTASL